MTGATRLSGDDIPDDIRNREAVTADAIRTNEKEFRIIGVNREPQCIISTEIPTIIRWIQSTGVSSFERVHINDDGQIVGAKATVPKGIIKFQSQARKSNRHSQMVAYGDARGEEDG